MLGMTKCVTISHPQERERIIQLFTEHQIDYKVKGDNVNQMGPLGSPVNVNSVRLSYTFYVKKDQLEAALALIQRNWE